MFCSTTPEKQRAEQLKCSGKQEERSWARQGFSDLVQNVSGRGNQNRKAGYANPTGHGKSLDVPADAAFLVITLLGKYSPTILSDYNARIQFSFLKRQQFDLNAAMKIDMHKVLDIFLTHLKESGEIISSFGAVFPPTCTALQTSPFVLLYIMFCLHTPQTFYSPYSSSFILV